MLLNAFWDALLVIIIALFINLMRSRVCTAEYMFDYVIQVPEGIILSQKLFIIG